MLMNPPHFFSNILINVSKPHLPLLSIITLSLASPSHLPSILPTHVLSLPSLLPATTVYALSVLPLHNLGLAYSPRPLRSPYFSS